jgi:hypothetical protein
MYVDPRMADPAYRTRTWAFLRECTARQEQLQQEADDAIREAGPKVGDTVALGPLQRGVVVSITGSPPRATVAWDGPTGRGGGTVRMQDTRWLKDLQIVEQPALQQAPESLLLAEPTADLIDAGINSPESGSDSTDACTI